MKCVEVVLKVTERCNIDCKYCYVFNKADQSYKKHPPIIKMETIKSLAILLKNSVLENGVDNIRIDFHGGEPCLLGTKRFDSICSLFLSYLSPLNCNLKFAFQTNAILLSDEWIELFSKYQISIGVSLDGPKHLNDKERVDFKGKGTYDQTIKGINLLQDAVYKKKIPNFGILAVSSPTSSSSELYDHFVKDLEIFNFDVLMPIDSHNDFKGEDIEKYKDYYRELFHKWTSENDERVNVRVLTDLFNSITDGDNYSKGSLAAREGEHTIFTVSSNGDIGPDDSLRNLQGGLFSELNVFEHSFTDMINSKVFKLILNAENTLPDDCIECPWQQLCRGGAWNGRLVNRFKQGKGFNNKSILCELHDDLFSEVTAYQLKSTLSYKDIESSLFSKNIKWQYYTDKQINIENNLGLTPSEREIEFVDITN